MRFEDLKVGQTVCLRGKILRLDSDDKSAKMETGCGDVWATVKHLVQQAEDVPIISSLVHLFFASEDSMKEKERLAKDLLLPFKQKMEDELSAKKALNGLSFEQKKVLLQMLQTEMKDVETEEED